MYPIDTEQTGKKNSFYKEKNHFFRKFNRETNIVMLINLDPILEFILEIKIIPNYLHGHMVAAMCFNMGNLVKKLGKNAAELEVLILIWPKKKHIL